ncbi:MAG: TraR/DksA C4-type zinc finger protein [Archangium sp.]|nr:TraR/DksA C4-type zinc finger protein [Archangium sp.]
MARRGMLSAAEQAELAEIDLALARIADGRYGQCESCGGPIGRGRLRALPDARRCLRCDERDASGPTLNDLPRSRP